MADINDLAQKIAFYQAGGKDPGTSNAEQFQQGYDFTHKIIADVLATKKAQYENQKTQAETQKLNTENAPIAEVLGTPVVKSQIASAENAPIPPEDLASGVLNSRQAGLDKAAQTSRDISGKFGDMTFGQYDKFANAQKDLIPKQGSTPEDLMPVSKMMTYAEVKKVMPAATPDMYATMTIGGLKQHVGYGKQEDLNKSRESNLGLRLDNSIMAAGNNLNSILEPIRAQRNGLARSQELVGLLKAGNTVAAASLGAAQAKAVGETGALSLSDVTRYTQSGWIPQRIGDLLGKALMGTPTNATADEILAVNQAMQTALDLREKELIREAASRLVENYGINYDDAVNRLGKATIMKPQAPPPGQTIEQKRSALRQKLMGGGK